MGTGTLIVDLNAIVDNWRALAALARVETGAVVKADGYGLGAGPVVAQARRGRLPAVLRRRRPRRACRSAAPSGPGPRSWSSRATWRATPAPIAEVGLTPLLNSVDQLSRHLETLPGHPFGVQLDTGMNRLGFEWAEWAAVAEIALGQSPVLLMSHLACADEADHPMNPYQLDLFRQMTDGLGVPRSLAATGGILLGPDYHFDLVRPGVGLYGGMPFDHARPVVASTCRSSRSATSSPARSRATATPGRRSAPRGSPRCRRATPTACRGRCRIA